MTMNFDQDAWFARYHDEQQKRAALQPGVDTRNKTVLLGALAGAGILRVEVAFDGYGDSGQVEAPGYVGADGATHDAISGDATEIQSVVDDGSGIETKQLAVGEAIEEVCYDLLRAHHAGWENNDGAYGDFVFDVEAGTITYTHNSRFTEVDTSVHEL